MASPQKETRRWVVNGTLLDFSLQLAPIVLGDFTTKDDGDFIGLADGSIGVE